VRRPGPPQRGQHVELAAIQPVLFEDRLDAGDPDARELNQAAEDAQPGAILAGRRGYDSGVRLGRQSRGIYGGAWHGPVFVLTHTPPDTCADPGITFLSNGLEAAVATARAAAAPKSLGIFGASIARQCLEHGLLDEIVVHIAPVLLGDGVRLYDAPGTAPIRLQRIPTPDPGQITDLHFRVLK
jgi:dihydrofolate reductase